MPIGRWSHGLQVTPKLAAAPSPYTGHIRRYGKSELDMDDQPARSSQTIAVRIARVNIAEMSDIHTCQALLAMMVMRVFDTATLALIRSRA
ncbi:hypothetical protein [Sinorhizobium sp. BJ1]|uniref:hypothetical protein n=1 Tax=Sinorhizobium sp. BJ1 TaxID=2035455 RepID=UPI00118520AA|nr:hypothetical protein [Sinorhizobium sp. BJ1]